MYRFPTFDGDRPGRWEPVDVIALLCQDGFMTPDDWRPVTAAATFLWESDGGDPLAQGKVVWAPGKAHHLSVDYGLFQLNSYYTTVTGHYPDMAPLTIAQCFDPFEAMRYAWVLMNKQRDGWAYNLKPWHGYTSGAYKSWVGPAFEGMRDYRVAMGLPWPGPFA